MGYFTCLTQTTGMLLSIPLCLVQVCALPGKCIMLGLETRPLQFEYILVSKAVKTEQKT